MGEDTTLGDLLELELHRVEDEVKNIVDKAVKEMGIEKVRSSFQHRKKLHKQHFPAVCVRISHIYLKNQVQNILFGCIFVFFFLMKPGFGRNKPDMESDVPVV